jgi:hypothetical protein
MFARCPGRRDPDRRYGALLRSLERLATNHRRRALLPDA